MRWCGKDLTVKGVICICITVRRNTRLGSSPWHTAAVSSLRKTVAWPDPWLLCPSSAAFCESVTLFLP